MGDGESTTSKTESTSSSDGGGGGGNPVVTEGSSGDGGGVSGGVVAGVVVVLLVVVGVLAVAAGLVGWVLYRRKRLGQQQLTSGTLNNIGMLIRCQKNCVASKPYSYHIMRIPSLTIDNEVYGKHYEMVPDYNATPYEVPQESLRKDGFNTLQPHQR